MSIETLHQLELLLHAELSKTLANRETSEFSKLSNAWIELWKEMDNKLSSHEGALLEQEVVVSQTFASNSDENWLPCFHYTSLQVGDKVRFRNDRSEITEGVITKVNQDVDGNDTVILHRNFELKKSRILKFLPVQQQ